MHPNKGLFTNAIWQIAQQWKDSPFVTLHGIEFMSEERCHH